MGQVKFTIIPKDCDSESKSSQVIISDIITGGTVIKPKNYDQSYGIDWCEMSKNLNDFISFQGTNVSDISHVIDDNTGQFINCSTVIQKKEKLLKLYKTEKYMNKDIPITWINLAKDKTATVDVSVYLKTGLELEREDYITFEHDDSLFTITYISRREKLTNAQIRLDRLNRSNNKVYEDIKIKALETFNTPKYILLKSNNGDEVGKIEMAPNDIVDLKIRIIPIVLSTDVVNKAQDLYNTIVTTNKLEDYLNNKSLNQVGLKVSIATFTDKIIVDTAIANLNTKFYDSSKKHFHDLNKSTLAIDFIGELQKIYLNKPENKTYKGALFFVTDKDYFDPVMRAGNSITGGFSKVNPLRYQSIMMFKSGINTNDTFAHELAHLLGAVHPFFENRDNQSIHEYTKNINIVDGKQYWDNEITDANNGIANDLQDMKKQPTAYMVEFLKGNIKSREDYIQLCKDKKRKIDLFKGTEFKVTKTKTLNFMDYDNIRTYFSKYQAIIMKQECKDFYQ